MLKDFFNLMPPDYYLFGVLIIFLLFGDRIIRMYIDFFDAFLRKYFKKKIIAKRGIFGQIRIEKISDSELNEEDPIENFVANLVNDFHPTSIERFLVNFFTLPLINKIKELFVKRVSSNTSEQALLNITIIGLLVGQKAKQSSIAFATLILAFLLYYLLSFFLSYEVRSEVLAFLGIIFILLFINQKALEYRIKKGLYGSNEYEAREILAFIIKHSDKSNFTDGSGLREIMPVAEPDNVYGIESLEGVRGVEA